MIFVYSVPAQTVKVTLGVLGLRGEWGELSDPIPNVCEQRSQAKRNLLQRMLSKLEYEARF